MNMVSMKVSLAINVDIWDNQAVQRFNNLVAVDVLGLLDYSDVERSVDTACVCCTN